MQLQKHIFNKNHLPELIPYNEACTAKVLKLLRTLWKPSTLMKPPPPLLCFASKALNAIFPFFQFFPIQCTGVSANQ